jgi:hypothetical protein
MLAISNFDALLTLKNINGVEHSEIPITSLLNSTASQRLWGFNRSSGYPNYKETVCYLIR